MTRNTEGSDLELVTLTAKQQRARTSRNLAIGLALAAFAALFWFGTMARMATKPAPETSRIVEPSK